MPEIQNKKKKDKGTCVTQIFNNGHPSHVGDRKAFEVMTST
jgi:hypothetical protein